MSGSSQPPPLRLAHFSDIHVSAKPLGWQRPDWFTKRFPGWLNYEWLGRKRRFRGGEEALASLVDELRRWRPDRVIFSGDATALGFEAEFARAAAFLGLDESQPFPGIAVPGNHDYYTPGVASSGLFERYFGPWQAGERVDAAVYPFAQRVGQAWLVGVNSCTGNRWFWDASGAVDVAQLDRLRTLLQRLSPGPRILVTHYPICIASGEPEQRMHGLRNLQEVVRTATAGGVCLWLHGHRHGAYVLACSGGATFPSICAGSATQYGKWTYFQYTLEGNLLRAVPRVFVPGEREFGSGEPFEVQLCSPESH